MSIKHEKGIKNSLAGEEEVTIHFSNNYIQSPVAKISSNSNTLIYIEEITNTYIKIKKSASIEMQIHYIIIERQ